MVGFSLWVGIGASIGLWRLARSAQRQPGEWVDAGLFVLIAALIGARLSYAACHLNYFAAHWVEVPMVWLGGLWWPGAILGTFFAFGWLLLRYRSPRTGRMSPGWLGDQLYPLLPSVTIAAWLGCWQAGSAYGQVVPGGAWWAVPAAAEDGLLLPRWPVQPLAAASLLLFFVLLERWVPPMRPPGRLSSLALLGLLLHLLVFTRLVADPAPYWYGLRADTWIALALLLVLLAFLALVRWLPGLNKRGAGSQTSD